MLIICNILHKGDQDPVSCLGMENITCFDLHPSDVEGDDIWWFTVWSGPVTSKNTKITQTSTRGLLSLHRHTPQGMLFFSKLSL